MSIIILLCSTTEPVAAQRLLEAEAIAKAVGSALGPASPIRLTETSALHRAAEPPRAEPKVPGEGPSDRTASPVVAFFMCESAGCGPLSPPASNDVHRAQVGHEAVAAVVI